MFGDYFRGGYEATKNLSSSKSSSNEIVVPMQYLILPWKFSYNEPREVRFNNQRHEKLTIKIGVFSVSFLLKAASLLLLLKELKIST